MTIAIINSGGANLGSVRHALGRLGVESVLTQDADTIRSADRVILPGVGAAASGMHALREAGLVAVMRELRQPVLGICLGLQLLYEFSEEGDVDCLGLMPGRVRRLHGGEDLRLPHMGWNRLEWLADDPLACGLDGSEWFYFVHGFAAPADRAVAVSEHGQRFAAVVRHNNVVACQFHPEKSSSAGARVLGNFLE